MEISSDEEITEIPSSGPGSKLKGKARESQAYKPVGRTKHYLIRPDRNGAFRATSHKASNKPPPDSEITVISDDEPSAGPVQTRTSQYPAAATANTGALMAHRHLKKPRSSSDPYVSALRSQAYRLFR